MIARIIDWCAANRFLVFTGTVALTLWGVWAMTRTPLDAVPDISDVQVIVSTEWMGRSPDLIEDQVTYPIVTTLLGAPRIKAIRGFSDFGFSYVYVIFQDGTDIYWARSRTMEYLSKILPRLPEGVQTELGPDAKAKEVVETLAAQRVRVTPAQVYNIKSTAGRPKANGYAALIQAKKLADKLGGVDKARAALDVLAKLL